MYSSLLRLNGIMIAYIYKEGLTREVRVENQKSEVAEGDLH